jgi:hypothetical protein
MLLTRSPVALYFLKIEVSDGVRPNDPQRKRSKARLPEHLKKRHMVLAICVSENIGLRIKAEAERRAVSYGSLLKPLFEELVSGLDSQQAA